MKLQQSMLCGEAEQDDAKGKHSAIAMADDLRRVVCMCYWPP